MQEGERKIANKNYQTYRVSTARRALDNFSSLYVNDFFHLTVMVNFTLLHIIFSDTYSFSC